MVVLGEGAFSYERGTPVECPHGGGGGCEGKVLQKHVCDAPNPRRETLVIMLVVRQKMDYVYIGCKLNSSSSTGVPRS